MPRTDLQGACWDVPGMEDGQLESQSGRCPCAESAAAARAQRERRVPKEALGSCWNTVAIDLPARGNAQEQLCELSPTAAGRVLATRSAMERAVAIRHGSTTCGAASING